jgi:hypothetical protein
MVVNSLRIISGSFWARSLIRCLRLPFSNNIDREHLGDCLRPVRVDLAGCLPVFLSARVAKRSDPIPRVQAFNYYI